MSLLGINFLCLLLFLRITWTWKIANKILFSFHFAYQFNYPLWYNLLEIYWRLQNNSYNLCDLFHSIIDSIKWNRCWSSIPTSEHYIYTCRWFGKCIKQKIKFNLHFYFIRFTFYYVTMSRTLCIIGLEWCWISWFGMCDKIFMFLRLIQ